jgi:hypothetical protein
MGYLSHLLQCMSPLALFDVRFAARSWLFRGHLEVVDADLADYFGSIPHAELLKSVLPAPASLLSCRPGRICACGRQRKGKDKDSQQSYQYGCFVEQHRRYVLPALLIAEMVRDRGYSTRITVLTECLSACPLIWFSGRHAVIQRAGQPNAEVNEAVVAYLQTVGLTERQARFLVNAALPSEGWVATEQAAYALGFRPQIISSLFGWRSCQAKFCLAIP